jgi:hypothetical protein
MSRFANHANAQTKSLFCRQPGNVFIDELSDLNHLSRSHVKLPPHARNTGEGGASVDHKVGAAEEPAPQF